MPIVPSLRPLVTKKIGAFLNGNDKIEGLVYEATGENPYVIWTNDRLPFRSQISDIPTCSSRRWRTRASTTGCAS
jgi:hypothetical protein